MKVRSSFQASHTVLSHFMAGGIIDQQNNSPVTCFSCHDPHGTTYEKFLRGSLQRELFIQCRKQYR